MFKEFFELYAAAFLSFNPSYISEVYDFPMTFYTEAGETVSFEEEAFTENTKKLIGMYEMIGVKAVSFEIESVVELSEKLKLVSVVWQFNNSTGSEIYHATTRYIFKQTESGAKIKSVIVVDETSKFSQLMQK